MNIGTMLNKDAPACVNCNQEEASPHNPLLEIDDPNNDELEHIHLRCAERDSQYGFCWCCRHEKVYFAGNLNADQECSIHEGESIPDYPEEDLESYIEYIQKNH